MAENFVLMKKLLLIASFYFIGSTVQAQEFPADLGDNQKYDARKDAPSFIHSLNDPNYKMALGLQYSYPFNALSFKYSLTSHSVVQALVSPFAISYGYYNYSFYGLRYIYRFPLDICSWYGPYTASYRYIYGGIGLLGTAYPTDGTGVTINHVSRLGWSLGAGYEIVFGKHFGVSAEVGLGNLKNNGNAAQTYVNYGGGLHYYFSGMRHHAYIGDGQPEADVPEDQDHPTQMAPEEQPVDDQPVKKTRRARNRRDDDDE